MNVGWLVDASVFDAYHEDLARAVVRNGQTIQSVNRPNPPYGWSDTGDRYRDAFPPGSCVVTHADIDLVCRVLDAGIWTPGAFASVDRFACTHYFSHLGRFLMSRDYTMLPFGELRRCQDFLFDVFGEDGKIFVRPDSCLKLFSGQLVSQSTFDRDLEFMAFYEFPIESLVVVSSPREIEAEWRFVVADQVVVAGSQYKLNHAKHLTADVDRTAKQLAEKVAAAGYAPDPVWILDICRTTDGEHHLLEIGAFSFADLYQCDKDAVVKAVSDVAWKISQSARSS
jgi:hypothetical protein